jgi:RNA polymerase sigma-70 factor (ECF subfamily)
MTETIDDLYSRLHEHVYHRALAIVRDPDDADDVAQLTWIKVARSLEHFRGDISTPATWIYAITSNCAFDWLRQQRRKRSDRRVTVALSAAASQPDGGMSPGAILLSKERARQLRAAVLTLPRSQRAALAACARADDYAAAARELGIPLGTYKSRLFRARVDALAVL